MKSILLDCNVEKHIKLKNDMVKHRLKLCKRLSYCLFGGGLSLDRAGLTRDQGTS